MLCSFKWTQQLFSKFEISKKEKKSLQIYSWMKELSRTCCCVESSSKKKVADCSHKEMGTYRDCWAQLYDGIPQKSCECKPKLNSSREHILWVREEALSQLRKALVPKMASAKHRGSVLLSCFCTQPWGENWTQKRTWQRAAHTSQRWD